MKLKFLLLLTNIFTLYTTVSFSQVIDLSTASGFSVFTSSGAFNSDGITRIKGDIGTNVGAFSGFPPGIVIGQIHLADNITAQAAASLSTAYGSVSAMTCGLVLGTTLGGGQSLTPNIYCLGAAATLNGNLTLNGQGNPNSVFIFQIDGAFSTGTSANIILTNSANLCNVYWQINGAFYLGINSVFQGTVLAGGQITLDINSTLNGRVLTTAGAVILHSTTVNINTPPSASISVGRSTNLCLGESVVLTSTIGNNYLWSSGETTRSITVSTAGSYTVTVSDGCGTATSAPTIVTVNPIPTATITANGPLTFCQGGNVILTATGGTSYLWSNGATTPSITVTTSGSYSTIATNGSGCKSTSATTVVTVNPNQTTTISANGPLAFCQGGSVVLTASSGAGYLWSTGSTSQSITVSSSGSYTVTATGACVTSSSPSVVTVAPISIPTITASGPLSFCQGESVILTSSSSNGYLWSTGATTQSITVTTSGNYSVTTTSNCGGTSATITVSVNSIVIPTITANGPTTFCPAGSVVLTSSDASGYLWNTGATTKSITVTNPGNYSVTTTGNCGGTSVATIITVNASTIPTITPNGPITLCPSGSVILTSSGANSYLWSNGATTQSITVTTAGNYTVTTTGSCAGTSSAVVVTVNPLAIPTINASGPLTFCQGGSVILTASSAIGYLWSTGATTQSITATTAGNYTVTTSGSCSGVSSPVSVTVIPIVIPVITANGPLLFCPEGSVTLTATASSGYLWSTGATTQSIVVTTAGTYSVTATSICGGTSLPVLVRITDIVKPIISASGPLLFCPGDSVILTSSIASKYLWSTGDTTQRIIVKTAGSYSVSTSGICSVSSTTSNATNVILNPTLIPVITVIGSTTICEGDSITLSASAGNGYLWSTGETTQSIKVKTGGSYFVTTSGFCGNKSAETLVNVSISTKPTIIADGPLSFCIEDSVLLTSSDASRYIWSNGDTSKSITVKKSGIYTVTTPGICAGVSDFVNVTVNIVNVPLITASGRINICIGDSVILTSSLDSRYLWSTGDSTRSIIVKQSGTYTVLIPGVCSDTSIPVIVSVNSLRKPTITADGPLSFCIGEDVILTASPGSSWWWSNKSTAQSIRVTASRTYSVRVYNECGYNYSESIYVNVSPGPDCTIITKSPFCKIESTQLCATADNVKYQWSTGDTTQCITINKIGTYSVTATNALGCTNICTKTITEGEYPDCTISVTPAICPQQDYILSAPTGVNLTYKWNTGATSQKIAVWKPGIYTLSVTNSNGCVSTCSTTVKEIAPLNCFIMGKTNLCIGESTELKGPMGAASYLWNNGDKGGWINVNKAGIYTLTITNAEGCVKQCSVTVTVEDCIVCIQGNGGSVTNFSDITTRKETLEQIFKVPNNVEISTPDIRYFNVQAFPNPFANSTIIEFSNPTGSTKVKVDVYNMQAQKVASIFEGILQKNEIRRARFDATNLIEGIYYYRMTDGKYSVTKKLILIKN